MKRFAGFRFAGILGLSLLLEAGWEPPVCHAQFLSLPLGGESSNRKDAVPTPGSGVSYYSGYMSSFSKKPADDAPPRPDSATEPPTAPSPGPRDKYVPAAQPPEALPIAPGGLPAPGSIYPGAPGQVPPDAAAAARGEVVLQPAPTENGDLTFPITLAAALRLADARPLIVGAAQASAWVAEAQLQRAKLIWVPTFNAGSDYIRHDGNGPDFNLGINTNARPLAQSVNFMYSGVGLTGDFALADAIFQPLAARQALNARRWDIQTAKNNALLQTANAYFNVHQYRGQYAGAVDVVQRGHMLVERIAFLSHDLVPKVEVDRAKSMLADIEQRAASARQNWRVSSADLTQILRLDPRVLVIPQEHDHLQITLIEPNRALDELIPIGLTNRPELATQQALVQAVAQRIRREKGRLLMPSIMLNGFQTPNELIELGVQGFGHGNSMNLWGLRDDFSPQALWQFEGMGFANMARIKEQRGEQSKAIIEVFKVQDGVAGDVTRAQARLQSAAVRVLQADRSLREAIITYDGNYQGLAQTKRFGNLLIQVYRPQEVVIALEHLLVSYDQYFATVADYNRSQFELFHALGYPAREVSALRRTGEDMPVETNRPGYLPPVGVGPPPSTR